MTIRCIPFENKPVAGRCIFTGEPSAQRAVWAKIMQTFSRTMSFILVINCEKLIAQIFHHRSGEWNAADSRSRRALEYPARPLSSRSSSRGSTEVELPNAKHIDVLDEILREMGDIKIVGVGHRVVHGGEAFKEGVKVDPNVVRGIDECIELAPLHNPANLTESVLPSAPGCPARGGFRYRFSSNGAPGGVPPLRHSVRFYEGLRVRRYGFHGTSHGFVAGQAAKVLESRSRSST